MRSSKVFLGTPLLTDPHFNLFSIENGKLWERDILFSWPNGLNGWCHWKKKVYEIIYKLCTLERDHLFSQRMCHNLLWSSLKILCIQKINLCVNFKNMSLIYYVKWSIPVIISVIWDWNLSRIDSLINYLKRPFFNSTKSLWM